jgi:hypothetical protein
MLNLVSLWWIDERDRPADVLADQLAELVWSGLAAGAGAAGATRTAGATGRQR